MGVVAETLKQLIGQQVAECGVVVWFDPECHFQRIAASVVKPEWTFVEFKGSFYELRAAIEPVIRQLDPPKLLVYIPLEYEIAKVPLVELLALGVVIRPGAAGSANSRLSVISKKALKNIVSESKLADLDEQIRKGQLTLDDLEQLGDEGGDDGLPTVLAVLYGTSVAEDVALDFLSNHDRDEELQSKNAHGELFEMLAGRFGLLSKPGESLSKVRASFRRQALCAELFESIGDGTPESLKLLLNLNVGLQRKRSAALARDWRSRRHLADSYSDAATTIEKSLHLDSIDFSDEALANIPTFESIERRLLRQVAQRLTLSNDEAALKIAENRRGGFWADVRTDLLAEWTLVAQAAELIQTSHEIESGLDKPLQFSEIVERYTRNHSPWSELDTLHRRLEKRASSLEFALSDPPEEIEQLVTKARQRYAQVAGQLAESFLRAWQTDSFAISGFYRQTQVFESFVEPLAREYRTAYLMVDALRLELARELPVLLGREFESQLEVVFGTAPSVTEVGMAALLPRASSGLELQAVPKLQVLLHGQPLRNREDRMESLKKNVGMPVVELKLEEPKNFKKKLKDLSAGPLLVVVTSREIDQSGEDQNTETREHMEKVLTHLVLALRKLAENGIERMVVVADHGYIFGEDLTESDKIAPPGGSTALLHRRVWIGEGGSVSASYLRTKVNGFGVTSDLFIATPWNLAAFKTAGPTAYFHGGLSPQEILLPVLTLTPRSGVAASGSKRLKWDLTLGSLKITSRFLSLTITGQSQGLFDADWPSVRVEVRSNGEVCSMPVSGTYGYNEATGEVALRAKQDDRSATEPDTVALMLTGKAPSHGAVSVHLLDAVSGVELKVVNGVEVSLAI
jgi:hypothetical protein